MIDSVLLVGLAAASGALVAGAPIEASIAAALMTLAIGRRARRAAVIVALAALAIQTARARAAIESGGRLHEETVARLDPPARCEGEAEITTSPVVLRGPDGPDAGALGDARADAVIDRGECGGRALEAPLRARVYGLPADLARGDRAAIVVDLAPVHLFLNEGSRDPRPGLARSGVAASGGVVTWDRLSAGRSVSAWVDRARAHVRARIDGTFHPEAAPLARALVLGEVDLDPADDAAFRASGLAHLLAVSGTHLVIAVAGFGAALSALLRRVEPLAARLDVGRVSAAACLPAAWLYADFAGGSGSAVRAAAMLSAVVLARALGRRPAPARSFGLALLGAALVDPLVASDVSFALSAAATAGLVFVQPPIARAIVRGQGRLRALLTSVATTLAATIACAPVLVTMAPSLPLLSVVANLVAAPLGETFALPVCLAHACLGWAPSAERGAALVGSGALLAVRGIARVAGTSATTLGVRPPTAGELAALAVAAAAAWAASDRRARVGAIAAGALAIAALEARATSEGAPTGLLRVTALDVGQGDAIAVDLPDGSLMLVDGGGFVGSPTNPGERVILPFLRAKRRARVDVAILSHPHPDHFVGLAAALAGVDVGELWDTGQGEDEGAGPVYAGMLGDLRGRGVPIRRPGELCGAPRSLGGARVTVLAPCPGPTPDAGANDSSFVIRLEHGARAVLLVGDAEALEEGALLRDHPAELRADLLKVGHHGSRTSTGAAFLAQVCPSIAVISSGVRNRFGHPHPTTLAALAARGVAVARTDRGGAFVWETDGDRVTVRHPGLSR